MMPAWLAAEVAEHKRRDTFGGYLWFPPMTVEEALAEAEWLLDGGVHPLLIADTLSITPASLYRSAKRRELSVVQAAFAPFSKGKVAA